MITELILKLIKSPPSFSKKQLIYYGFPTSTFIFYYVVWPRIKRGLRRLLTEEEELPETDVDVTNDITWVHGFSGLIGKTPMVRLKSLSDATGCNILAKVEYLNPGGSGHDRTVLQIIEDCEKRGLLREGGALVEGSNEKNWLWDVSLALICRSRGYRCILVMPPGLSEKKMEYLKKIGAEIKFLKPSNVENSGDYYKAAEQLAKSVSGAVFVDQYNSTFDYRAHYTRTAPEIWAQTKGFIDAFVAGARTGGLIAGMSKFLKWKNPKIQVFLVDPPGSCISRKVKHGVYSAEEQFEQIIQKQRYMSIVEDIGSERSTQKLQKAEIDDAYKIPDQTTVHMAHFLLKKEGLFVGTSSAICCVGAVLAAQKLGPGHTVVTVLSDSGLGQVDSFWDRAYIEKWGLQWPESRQIQSIDFLYDMPKSNSGTESDSHTDEGSGSSGWHL